MLQLNNLHFGYNRNLTNIKDISLTINEGEFIALCGRNGSGKTTLSRLMMGMEKPDKGSIFLNDLDITKYSITRRSAYIGYVFQQPECQMFKNTVAEEIAFGLEQRKISPDEIKSKVQEMMEKLDLTIYANQYPLSLSKSLKQKIAIASALILEPKILILDEPTSGQDAENTKDLMELLAKLVKEGLTIILITHNMDIVAEYTSRIITLAKGVVAYDGIPEGLFMDDTLTENLGLRVPVAVELANKVLNIPFCKSLEEFTSLYKFRLEGGKAHG